MRNADTARRIAYIVIVIGVALAFAGSIVPFYNASYHLSTGLLIFQLVPYLVYSTLTIQKNGYATGLFGKWHCGYPDKFNPVHHGFDEFVGFLNGGADFHRHAPAQVAFLPVG